MAWNTDVSADGKPFSVETGRALASQPERSQRQYLLKIAFIVQA
ncbi:hypothetical protein [Escherichia coli]